MSRRALIAALAALLLAAPAHAQGKVTLVPGVTYEAGVEFTTHGPVAFHVLVAPRPGGPYALRPALARDAILGTETVTSMQRRLMPGATVAGVNGDLFNSGDGHPTGIVLRDGALEHPPLADRSSVGVDSGGTLHVDRVRFSGIWRGTGQRRALNGVNQSPADGQVVLFTRAWGPTTPIVPGVVEATVAPLPPAAPNMDLAGPVTAVTQNGGTAIPGDGAVLVARGAAVAPKLQAEAPVGTTLGLRLLLQPEWTGMRDALGGGPVLVRDGTPVFRSFEGFSVDQLLPRNPRTAVGQLADGRIILLAVDGRAAGYSVGLTNFELAQTMARLGAVTASALDAGGSTTMAFEGRLLSRPSDPTGERAVKESLNVLYYGVYVPTPEPEALTATAGGGGQAPSVSLAYKIVRPSSVTAQLLGPGGVTITLEAPPPADPATGVAPLKPPGTYAFTWDGLDPATGRPAAQGRWTWRATAVDERGQSSTQSRALTYDTTLAGLTVSPRLLRLPPQGGVLSASVVLNGEADVLLRIESPLGTLVRAVARRGLGAGTQTIVWDGRLPSRALVPSGRYVARVLVTSRNGTTELDKPFAVRRTAAPGRGPKPARK